MTNWEKTLVTSPSVDHPPTLAEVAVVAGTTRALARAASADEAIDNHALSWIDALILRVYSTVTSTQFPGDPHQRARESGRARAALAVSLVREEVLADRLRVAAQLVVTRDLVKLAPDLGHVFVYLDQDLAGLETAQVLPIGRWWYEMRWRMGGQVAELFDVAADSHRR